MPGEKANVKIPCVNRRGYGYYTLEVFNCNNRIYVWQKELMIEKENSEIQKGSLLLLDGKEIKIKGEKFTYSFSKVKPIIKEVVYNGKKILKNHNFSLYRAPIDNDRLIKDEWSKDGAICKEGNLYNCVTDFTEMNIEEKDCSIKITYKIFVGTMGKKPIFKGEISYTVYSDDGLLNIFLSGEIRRMQTCIPIIL